MYDRFPICYQHTRAYEKLRADSPDTVPWGMVAACAARVRENHGAELTAVAHRGGLTPCEIMAALEDRSLDESPNPFMAVRLLRERLDQWERPLARDVEREVALDAEPGVLLVPVVLRGPETTTTLQRIFGRTYHLEGVGRARIKGYRLDPGQSVAAGARIVVNAVPEVA